LGVIVIELFLVLLPILFTDVINPVLLAATIFALGSARPYVNSLLILIGWLLLYFTAGIGLALGLEQISSYLANPRPLDFIIELVVGLALLAWGLWLALKKPQPGKDADYGEAAALTGAQSLVIGAGINLIGLPFAIPYFAAIDQILKADLTSFAAIIWLLGYNLLYILPFALLIIGRAVLGKDADKGLARLNAWMEKAADFILPVMLLIIGGALLADAMAYFVSGMPLF
jgi:cytochrome c biogenesis protein CcdA